MASEAWKAKTVRNYIWQVISFKSAVVLDAVPSVVAEPLDDTVDYATLQDIAASTKHELERLGHDRIRSQAFKWGATCGTGIAHVRHEKDRLSGESKVRVDMVDPRRFYPDPGGACPEDWHFCIYEPELDMATVRDMFGAELASKVKPGAAQIIGDLYPATSTRSRSNDEIVYGPGGEFLVKDGKLSKRKANVAFIWIKDESLTEDVSENVLDSTVISRAYPYGRLIVISGEAQLYDGPSPYEIDTVFPFAFYVHEDVPGEFWGFSDVDLLKSCQMVADKNSAQLLDAMRLTGSGVFEYPSSAEGYTNLGNSPGQMVPVPDHLSGAARWVSSSSAYNGQLHSVLDEMTLRDFQRVSGISDVSVGTSPTAPTSGVEVQARQRAASTRIGQHMKNLSKFSTDLANIVYRFMTQFYVGPRTFTAAGAYGDMTPMTLDMSLMPRAVNIRLSADPDAIEKDRLQGQNLAGIITSGALFNPQIVPFLDILLPAMGLKPTLAKELQRRLIAMPPMFPPALGPASAAGTGEAPPATPSGAPIGSGGNSNRAFQALGAG